jgi:fatty acid desaturase
LFAAARFDTRWPFGAVFLVIAVIVVIVVMVVLHDGWLNELWLGVDGS